MTPDHRPEVRLGPSPVRGTGVRLPAAHVLGVLVALAVQCAPALAGPCDGESPPSVIVNSPRHPVVYDRSKAIAELTAMMGNDHLSGAGFVTLGVTAVDYSTTITSNVQSRRDRTGGWCAYPINVIVEHGFAKPVKVYIAREVQEGTCKYAATMDHEMQHVRIHEAGLWKARIAVDREVAEAVRRRMPVRARSSEDAIREVNDIVSEAVDRAVKAVTSGVQEENDAMDTPEAYLAFSRQCQD